LGSIDKESTKRCLVIEDSGVANGNEEMDQEPSRHAILVGSFVRQRDYFGVESSDVFVDRVYNLLSQVRLELLIFHDFTEYVTLDELAAAFQWCLVIFTAWDTPSMESDKAEFESTRIKIW
jgi:hypothetical protein